MSLTLEEVSSLSILIGHNTDEWEDASRLAWVLNKCGGRAKVRFIIESENQPFVDELLGFPIVRAGRELEPSQAIICLGILSLDLANRLDPDGTRTILWTDFSRACSHPFNSVLSAALEYVKLGGVTICARTNSDAQQWSELLGYQPQVVNLELAERALIDQREPIIDRVGLPRLLIDLGSSQFNDLLLKSFIATRKRNLDTWCVFSGTLKPWMRPDMQFRDIPRLDRGAYIGAVDAVLLDSHDVNFKEKLEEYLSAGVLPIPVESGGLICEVLQSIGLEILYRESDLGARLDEWLNLTQGDYSFSVVVRNYAVEKGYVIFGGSAEISSAFVDSLLKRNASIPNGSLNNASQNLTKLLNLSRRLSAECKNYCLTSKAQALSLTGWASESGFSLFTASEDSAIELFYETDSSENHENSRSVAFKAVHAFTPSVTNLEKDICPLQLLAVSGSGAIKTPLRVDQSVFSGAGKEKILFPLAKKQAGFEAGISCAVVKDIKIAELVFPTLIKEQLSFSALDEDGRPISGKFMANLIGSHTGRSIMVEAQADGRFVISQSLISSVDACKSLLIWTENHAFTALIM